MENNVAELIDSPDDEGNEHFFVRLQAGLFTLRRLIHYPIIYQMILNILSYPGALNQVFIY